MAETAAHLADHVLPEVPVRQWVLSMPWRLRYLLATDPPLLRAVRRTFLRAVLANYRSRARRLGLSDGRSGAVHFVQRFGSALNLNVHFHALLLDGVYTVASPWSPPLFEPAPGLEDGDVAELLRTVRDRIVRLLHRRGLYLLANEDEEPESTEDEPDAVFPFLAAASIQGRTALGPEAGRPLERFRGQTPRELSYEPGSLCASLDGFSLHAKVHVQAHDRAGLEHLCRYIARPPHRRRPSVPLPCREGGGIRNPADPGDDLVTPGRGGGAIRPTSARSRSGRGGRRFQPVGCRGDHVHSLIATGMA